MSVQPRKNGTGQRKDHVVNLRHACLFALAQPLFCLLGQGAGMALAEPPRINPRS
jgi:hypothetical protein